VLGARCGRAGRLTLAGLGGHRQRAILDHHPVTARLDLLAAVVTPPRRAQPEEAMRPSGESQSTTSVFLALRTGVYRVENSHTEVALASAGHVTRGGSHHSSVGPWAR
jgi:hypothetical protein